MKICGGAIFACLAVVAHCQAQSIPVEVIDIDFVGGMRVTLPTALSRDGTTLTLQTSAIPFVWRRGQGLSQLAHFRNSGFEGVSFVSGDGRRFAGMASGVYDVGTPWGESVAWTIIQPLIWNDTGTVFTPTPFPADPFTTPFETFEIRGMSDDGNAFLTTRGTWTQTQGLMPFTQTWSGVEAINSDGSLLGGSINDRPAISGPGGTTMLAMPADATLGTARAFSIDGRFVGGFLSDGTLDRMAVWDVLTGQVVRIAEPVFGSGTVTQLSEDGSIAFGSRGAQATLWVAGSEPQSAIGYLTMHGVAFGSLTDITVSRMSADGRTFAGEGMLAGGAYVAWVVTVPSPSACCLLLATTLALLRRRR